MTGGGGIYVSRFPTLSSLSFLSFVSTKFHNFVSHFNCWQKPLSHPKRAALSCFAYPNLFIISIIEPIIFLITFQDTNRIMVVYTFTPHIAKFARFSLGRFTNRWANEEELKLVLYLPMSISYLYTQDESQLEARKGT